MLWLLHRLNSGGWISTDPGKGQWSLYSSYTVLVIWGHFLLLIHGSLRWWERQAMVRSHEVLNVVPRSLNFSKKPMRSHLKVEACYSQICVLQRLH